MLIEDTALTIVEHTLLHPQPRRLSWFAAAADLSTPEAMLEPPVGLSGRDPACLRSLRWQIASTEAMLGRH